MYHAMSFCQGWYQMRIIISKYTWLVHICNHRVLQMSSRLLYKTYVKAGWVSYHISHRSFECCHLVIDESKLLIEPPKIGQRCNFVLSACLYVAWVMTKFDCHTITSSYGNFFRVTGPLPGESTGHRWIPLTKASDAERWCFRWTAPEQTV